MTLSAFGLLAAAVVLLAVLGLRAQRRQTQTSSRPTRFSITYNEDGFCVEGLAPYSTERARMAWAEVCRVAAYKEDLFTDFCLDLCLSRPDGTGITVDEDMAGWEPFCAALPQLLPGIAPMPSLLGQIPTSPASVALYTRATAVPST